MSEREAESAGGSDRLDAAPGEQEGGEHPVAVGVANYLIGLGLAAALTAASFWVASGTSLIYPLGVPMALAALAIGQMGVHLAFFLHITTGPDNTNNALALAFGVLIVGIVIAGSLWITMYPHEHEHDGAERHVRTFRGLHGRRLHASRLPTISATRSAFAMMVNVGLTALIEGKKLASAR